MSTDFNYGGKQIVISGPIKPGGKDMPSDARTRVESYADIASIPNPHIGLKITVKVDETNNKKMTDYIVKSLKANSAGIANTLIDEVVRYADYLGVSSSGGGTGTGLTTEQAQQLQTAYEHSQSTHVNFDDIPTNISDLTNDSGFINSNYVGNKRIVYLTKSQYDSLSNKSDCLYIVTDETEFGSSGGTSVDLSNYYTKTQVDSNFATKDSINGLQLKLEGKILKLYSGISFIASVDLSSLSSGGSAPSETYGDIVTSLKSITIAENGEGSFGVSLSAAPINEQVINISASNSYCTVSPSTLTFTSENYSTQQSVTVTGVHSSTVYTNQQSEIILSSDNVTSQKVDVTITNIDETPVVSDNLTRDGLVYYVDIKDQTYNKDTLDSAYLPLNEDTNELFSSNLTLGYMEYREPNANITGNVIENNVLKSSGSQPVIISDHDTAVSKFENKKITLEFMMSIPETGSMVSITGNSLFLRKNESQDLGIYLITSGGNFGYFNFSTDKATYNNPHLYTAVIHQENTDLCYELYVDGVIDKSDTLSNKTINDITTIRVLEKIITNTELASIRIYNKALSADEVANNYTYESSIERGW